MATPTHIKQWLKNRPTTQEKMSIREDCVIFQISKNFTLVKK